MESRMERYRQPKRPRWVRILINIGLLSLLFVTVIGLSNWMAPTVLSWFTTSPVTEPVAAVDPTASPVKSLDSSPVVVKQEVISATVMPTTLVVATASPEPVNSTSTERLKMRFVGDVLLGSRVGDYMNSEGMDYPYRYVQNDLQRADFTMGNLEAPVTTGGKAQDKSYVFKVDEKHLPGLKNAGFDLLTLANNHTYDYGVEGLKDTLKALKAQSIPYVGAGMNDTEAYTPYVFEKNGMKVAVFGFSRVLPTIGWAATSKKPGLAQIYDNRYAIEAIRRWRGLADLVIVYNHWGVERSLEPKAYQPELARSLIDAGADLVVGSHPHVLQGIENYNGKWIVYSLGNFIFTTSGSLHTSDSMILDADCTRKGECALKMTPVQIVNAQPRYPDAGQASQIVNRLNELSMKMGTRINQDGAIELANAQTAVTP